MISASELAVFYKIRSEFGTTVSDRQKIIYIYYATGGKLTSLSVSAMFGSFDISIVRGAMEIVPERMEINKQYKDEIEKHIK